MFLTYCIIVSIYSEYASKLSRFSFVIAPDGFLSMKSFNSSIDLNTNKESFDCIWFSLSSMNAFMFILMSSSVSWNTDCSLFTATNP